MSTVALVAAALVGLLAAFLLRERAQSRRLRRRLEAATGELQHLQTSFERFAPREVVDRIAGRTVPSAAERKEVTVLFADLVGFTALSETLAPEVLVRILRDYFERMSVVVHEHRGHVAKFLGDGFMALFGALEDNPWQANDAVHAALGMRAALEAYNRELIAAGRTPLACGVGVHRGLAVAGVIGSNELLEFTVVGHTANLAARVQELTREHGVDILITDAVRGALHPGFELRPLPPATVKGVSEPLATWTVVEWRSGTTTA